LKWILITVLMFIVYLTSCWLVDMKMNYIDLIATRSSYA